MRPQNYNIRGWRFHPFLRLAEALCRCVIKEDRRLPLSEEISALSQGRRGSVRDYYVRKTASVIMLAVLLASAAAAVYLYVSFQDRAISENSLPRPDYGEADLEQDLDLSIPGEEESESLTVHISSRKYTDAQVRSFLKNAETELRDHIAGENESLDEIRHALNFPKTLQDGLVEAEYSVSPSEMVDDTGQIIGKPEKSGSPVTIEVSLCLQENKRVIRLGAVIYPPLLSDRQLFQTELEKSLKEADEKDPASEEIRLPQSAGGKTLSWKHPKSSFPGLVLAMALLLPVLFWVQKDEKIRQKAAERKVRLDLDYSELLFKLTLLLGAGLTIRSAFARICAQGQEHDSLRLPGAGPPHADNVPLHPVYGEIQLMLREISSGVPEGTAYENFGRRCGLPQYIKLGSLLAQNLKKGSRGLTSLLEKEAFLSLQQHRTAARKMGEKAAMKMLFPMILMFIDVLFVLMVPALINM